MTRSSPQRVRESRAPQVMHRKSGRHRGQASGSVLCCTNHSTPGLRAAVSQPQRTRKWPHTPPPAGRRAPVAGSSQPKGRGCKELLAAAPGWEVHFFNTPPYNFHFLPRTAHESKTGAVFTNPLFKAHFRSMCELSEEINHSTF